MISESDPVPRSAAKKLKHIRELDGARGIAALMVFFHHVGFSTVHTDAWGPAVHWLKWIFVWGSSGVDLFFVLSGFLITSILIETRPLRSYYADFYWKRILRIQPLYVVCLLLVLLIYPHLWPGVVLSALFVVNFGAHFHILMFGPFWSLAIEEQFYLVWPSVVRRRSVRQIAYWSAAIAIASMLIRVVGAYFGHHNYYYTFYKCDGLALGALIACWFERRALTQSSSQDGRNQQGSRLENIVLNGCLASGVAMLVVSFSVIAPQYEYFVGACFQTGVTLTAAGLIGRLVRDAGRWYLAPFRSRLLTFFGLISYAFYLLHMFVLAAYDHVRPLPADGGDDRAYFVRLLTVLVLSTASALLTRYAIELPALSLRKHVLKAPSLPPVTAEPLDAL